MKTKKEMATEAFRSGFNCAQSVVSAFCDEYGIDKATALKLAGGMGSGFRSGEICGAASGGAMVVGLKYGQSVEGDADSKRLCGKKTKEFLNIFKEKNSSVTCRDILKIDPTSEDGQKQFREKGLNSVCSGMIVSAVEILEELGY